MFTKRKIARWFFVVLMAVPTMLFAAISQDPLFLTQSAAPRVMFAMSNDHQLSVKAYTDYTDLDGDGLIEKSYLDTFEYYGYFDSLKCYKYDSTDKRFEPDGSATGTNNHFCAASNQWSGNWLNWATMTRMDVVRKVLYGGKRAVDGSETVLERAMLPNDVHAFAKVFSTSTTAEMKNFTPYSKTDITVCNTSFINGVSTSSILTGDLSTATFPPLLQVADGSYAQWAQSEVHQCMFRPTGDTNNAINGSRPFEVQRLMNPDAVMRVQVCVAGSEEANCKTYSSNSKPTGILQQYGEDSAALKMNFGLITGSYEKNTAGGVLRKNVVPFIGNSNNDDEVNTTTGIINYLDASLTSAQRSNYAQGIIHTLDSIRISERNTSGRRYNCASSPCKDWGNPLGEIYLEGLRYMSGKTSATAAFDANDANFVDDLTKAASWVDPQPSTEWCADLSMITLSTGLNSYDTDQLTNDIGLSVNTWTDKVGTAEGIDGKDFYIGEGSADLNKQCTAKTVDSLSDAKGICPEIPTLAGGFGIAGMAYYANTNDIRTDITPSNGDTQTLTTYAVSLAETLPRIQIPLSNGKSIDIQPVCTNNSKNALCSLTDMTVLELNADGTKGSVDISWEDAKWGSDYDMDYIQNITFCAESACATNPGVEMISVVTEIRQNVTSSTRRLGYRVIGSSDDQTYLPLLKHIRQDYTYQAPAPAATSGNTLSDFAGNKTWKQGVSVGSYFENPLWYTAKYGAFKDNDGDGTPIEAGDNTEWDADGNGVPDGFFNARDPSKLFASLGSILQSIVARDSSSSTIATNSTRLDTDSKVYQARFTSGSWDGDIWAYALDPVSGVLSNPNTPTWKASELIPAENLRDIFTSTGSVSSGVAFEHTNLTSTQKAQITAAQVNYIRGDRAGEGSSVRSRVSVLGDIINSDPLYTGQEDFDYYQLELDVNGLATYDDYLRGTVVNTDKGVRQAMIYFGANDGMLHGIRGSGVVGSSGTPCNVASSDCEGEEVFSYIPKALFNKSYDNNKGLKDLASLNYAHQYMVDGSPKAGDAFIKFEGSTKRWGTALVGILGAGGKGIFALDVSNPLSFDANDVLWDLGESDFGSNGNGSYLGYTFSQPTIVKLANGDWGAVFGNGYQSDSREAALLIVNLETGLPIAEIATGEIGTVAEPNGLSTPIVIDTDNDRVADTVYAGDLKGNLWKFDISDSNTSKWAIAIKQGNTYKPLFTACSAATCTTSNRQPITSKPQVASSTGSGVMVLFGTGKYFETGDNLDTSQVQTYYGIRDTGSEVSGRGDLVAQTIDYQGAATGLNYEVRVTSDNSVDYSVKSGWYMDLIYNSQQLGERVVANSLVRNGRVIFPTLIPETDACSFGGNSWLMEVDAQTGSRLSVSPFDLNDDGEIDVGDFVDHDNDPSTPKVPVSGKKSKVGIIKTPGVISTGADEKKYASGTTGNIEVTTESGGDTLGRQSWQQIK
ncbi:pilus assembly protein [Aliamphritea ceti]|uniref:pilus assembly protein n=1 Tax=Aliamphritea ceti TaxID=1524258 RepID=UPI0021C39EC2|nr:PilC/PilY family type IV pilus protein [Aliamphritea ceti]